MPYSEVDFDTDTDNDYPSDNQFTDSEEGASLEELIQEIRSYSEIPLPYPNFRESFGNGNNQLHVAFYNGDNFKKILTFLFYLEKINVRSEDLLCAINQQDELPIEMMDSDYTREQRDYILNKTKRKLPPLNDDLVTHAPASDSALTKYFEVLKKTRGLFGNSTTLSQVNDQPLTGEDEISSAREQIKRQRYNPRFIHNIVQQTKQGNCAEMASVFIVEYAKAHPQSEDHCEVVVIKNGNHVFNVVNRDVNSTINAPSTWGERAIIVDVWSGAVYPAKDIQERLQCLPDKQSRMRDPYKKCILRNYNPDYHQLKLKKIDCEEINADNNLMTLSSP